MIIDGRVVTSGDLDEIIAGTKFNTWDPKFPEVHNTSVPDIALFNTWKARGTPSFEQWLRNLAAYYSGKGWKGGPHFFVAPDGRIGMLTPMNQRGTHSPSWNDRAIGIEVVGEFEREVFVGTSSERALIVLLGALCWHRGWDPNNYVKGKQGIHFHKEDLASSHRTCPGKGIVKEKLVSDVRNYIEATYNGGHPQPPSNEAATIDMSTMPPESMGPRAIWWVQERLNAWLEKTHPGFTKLKVDGDVGPKTEKAVRLFQTSTVGRLQVDGIPGTLTRRELNKI